MSSYFKRKDIFKLVESSNLGAQFQVWIIVVFCVAAIYGDDSSWVAFHVFLIIDFKEKKKSLSDNPMICFYVSKYSRMFLYFQLTETINL